MQEHLFNLKGKTALITGASSGIGERFAKTLSQAGAKVILAARRLEKLETLAAEIISKGGQAIPLQMDVSNKTSIREALDTIFAQGEKIDILINSAGIAPKTAIFEADEEEGFEATMYTNLIGVWHITKLVANHMKEQEIEGSIISIASVWGANRLGEYFTAYAMSKAGVIQMTKALVGELSPYKIRINAISPGRICTPMSDNVVSEAAKNRVPLKFVPGPEALDGAILYLASHDASYYVTGTCLTVDGGASWGGIPRTN